MFQPEKATYYWIWVISLCLWFYVLFWVCVLWFSVVSKARLKISWILSICYSPHIRLWRVRFCAQEYLSKRLFWGLLENSHKLDIALREIDLWADWRLGDIHDEHNLSHGYLYHRRIQENVFVEHNKMQSPLQHYLCNSCLIVQNNIAVIHNHFSGKIFPLLLENYAER